MYYHQPFAKHEFRNASRPVNKTKKKRKTKIQNIKKVSKIFFSVASQHQCGFKHQRNSLHFVNNQRVNKLQIVYSIVDCSWFL